VSRLLVIQDRLRHGGSESHSVWLAGAMGAAGVTTRLLTFRPGGALAARATAAGIDRVALQPFDTGLDWFAPGLARAAAAFRPDAVLLMGKLANARAATVRRAVPAARLVGSVRTGFALPHFVRRALPVTDRIVCNAAKVAGAVVAAGIGRERIVVIPNPPVRPVPPPDPVLRVSTRAACGAGPATVAMVSVAGFRAKKGQAHLIRALAAANAPRLVLWLVGDGPERGACERLAASLGVADRVVFAGYREDPEAYFAGADLAVMASETDAMPNALSEAQLRGLPVIAWDFGGCGETFEDGVSGWLTPFGDTAALGAAMRRLADDDALRSRYAAAAACSAPGRFSAEAALDAYRRVFGFR